MSLASINVLAAGQRLQSQDKPFALVSVVRVEPPASARPGDKALVTEDGRIEGWIGGGCAQPAVMRTVRQALIDGRARLIRITPAAEGRERDLGDVLEFGMTCHSGGAIELFVDPVLPAAQLVIVGDSPVAMALSGLAPRVGLQVIVIAHNAEPGDFPDARRVIASDDASAANTLVSPGGLVVVATQGRRDLPGLRVALSLKARKIFFVASARKAQVLRDSLVSAGQDRAAVDAIEAPAGHAIGAQTPEEIALAVLAAVVTARRGGVKPAGTEEAAPVAPPAPRPPIAPLPDLPPIAGSCCSHGAHAAAAAPAFATQAAE